MMIMVAMMIVMMLMIVIIMIMNPNKLNVTKENAFMKQPKIKLFKENIAKLTA